MQPTTNNSPPRNRKRWWMWFTFAAVLLSLTTAVVLHVLSSDTPINRLKRQIRIDVPVGSTREQVEFWGQRNWGTIASTTIITPPPEGPGINIYEEAGVARLAGGGRVSSDV